MTISSVTSKVIYVGDGATLVFAYPFKIFAEADLVVSDYNVSTTSTTVLTLNTDYLVSGVGLTAGGNVTLSGSYTSLPTGSKLVIQREMPLTQLVDYVENDSFPAETHEDALDKITMVCQQLQEQVDRAVKSDITTNSAGVIYIDADASASSAVVALAAQVATASSAAVSVVQASNAVVSASQASTSSVACASSATVAVAQAVLASTYAGSVNYTKDNDGTLTSNSDLFVASQKATKTYADTKAPLASPTFTGTLNAVTIVGTLVSSTTSYVTGTANATTISVTTCKATTVTASTVNVSGTMNATNVKGDGSLLTGITSSSFGAWDASSYSVNTAYLAATDGIVCAVITLTASGGYAQGLTDAANPPTTVRAYSRVDSTNIVNSVTFPVIKGQYWKVLTDTGSTVIHWLPLGS